MIFGIFKVSGHSMMPTFLPQDQIVVSNVPYLLTRPKAGDIILFRYNKKILVKRIVKYSNKKIFVEGDNKKDSLKIQSIGRDDILGKYIFKI